MKIQSNRSKILGGLVAFAIVVAAVLGLAVNQPAKQAGAFSTWNSFILASGNGVTSTVTGALQTGMTTYDVADCYSNYVSASAANTMTVAIYHGDNTGTVLLYTYAQQTSAGSLFTRTIPYGRGLYAVATISGTNPITFSVRCIAKMNN